MPGHHETTIVQKLINYNEYYTTMAGKHDRDGSFLPVIPTRQFYFSITTF